MGLVCIKTNGLRRRFGRGVGIDVRPYLSREEAARWRRVVFIQSSHRHSPLVFGFFKHHVVLPAAWDGWSDGCKRTVLLHELAHLRQYDPWVFLLRTLAQACYFYHPLIWILNRRLSRYTEMACDDATIAAGGLTPVAYARQLLLVAESTAAKKPASVGRWLVPGFAEFLKPRIAYVLDGAASVASPRVGVRRSLVAGLLVLLVPSSWDSLAPRPPAPVDWGPSTHHRFVLPARYEAPRPVAGFDALKHGPGAAERDVMEGASEEETAVVVQVAVNEAGQIIETMHVRGGCTASYDAVRSAVEAVPWQPARRNGTPVQARLHLSFLNKQGASGLTP